MRAFVLLPAAALLCLSAHAATCTVSSDGLSFGSYNALDHRVDDTIGHVTIACSGTQGESVSISLALTPVATRNGARVLKSQGHPLQYGLFLDSARTQPWGDGTAGTSVLKDTLSLSNGHATQDYTIYGRMAANQSQVHAGAYTDTQLLNLSW